MPRHEAKAMGPRLRAGVGDPARLGGHDPVARGDEALDARAMHEGRAAVERRGDRRHQHRLLRVRGAPHAAVAEVPAAADVAPDGGGGNAEPLAAPAEDVVVLVGRDRPGRDREPLLHAREPRGELRLARARRGRGRRASARAFAGGVRKLEVQFTVVEPPTLRPCRIGDRLVLRLPPGRFLVELRVGLALAHAEIARALERPFLDDHHREPRLGEDLGRHAAARAAADDQDVGLERQVAIERGGIDHLPAAGDAVADRVGDHDALASSGGGPGYAMPGHEAGLPYQAARTSCVSAW